MSTDPAASAAPITVYANPLSPYVNKVRAFLNLKGLTHEVFYVDPIHQKQQLAFSEQTAVPVVTVGDDVLVDSTPICLRLDEMFAGEAPGLPASGPLRDKLLEIDRWISDRLIPTGFFASQYLPLSVRLRNGRLSGRIHSVTAPGRIPLWMRVLWPLFVARAKFVSGVIAHIDPQERVSEVRRKAAEGFVERLEGGPFLGGQTAPSLPDCAAYGHYLPCYMGGMTGYSEFLDYPEIREWFRRMTALTYEQEPFWPERLILRDPRKV